MKNTFFAPLFQASLLTLMLIMGPVGLHAQSGENIGTSQQPLRGGKVITGFTGIVEFTSNGGGCTGSMIAPNVVLAAAHCFRGAHINSKGWSVFRIVYHDPVDGRVEVYNGLATRYVPASYNGIGSGGPGESNDDIGLILISGKFANTDYRDYLRIYADNKATLMTNLDAYGAGKFKYDGNNNDGKLRTHWFEVENVENNHIVIDNRDMVTTCKGDSGGPLIFTATAPEGRIPTIAGVLSQQEVEPLIEGKDCANNDPPFDDSFYSRTNWQKFKSLTQRVGLTCRLQRGANKKYRRCFDVPFVNDAVAEGFERNVAVAIVVSSIS